MFLLFDIGGTKTRIALSHDGKTHQEPRIITTPKNPEEGIAEFKEIAQELAADEPIEKAVGGIAGPLDREKNALLNSPNLPEWVGFPLHKKLAKELGKIPVFLENDAALVGLGEATTGAGSGYSIVAYITISTGVGGVRIVDGAVDQNALGFEPGHQIMGTLPDGSPRYLEKTISGRALEKRLGKKPYEVTDNEVWDELARHLAFGLVNTVVHWSPDIVVLGGSMMKKIGIPIDRVQSYLKKSLYIFPEPPPLVKGTLGDEGGLFGALALLKNLRNK